MVREIASASASVAESRRAKRRTVRIWPNRTMVYVASGLPSEGRVTIGTEDYRLMRRRHIADSPSCRQNRPASHPSRPAGPFSIPKLLFTSGLHRPHDL